MKNSIFNDLKLEIIVIRIRHLASSFSSIHFFHVLRGNNKKADREANNAAALQAGTLLRNHQDEDWDPPPWSCSRQIWASTLPWQMKTHVKVEIAVEDAGVGVVEACKTEKQAEQEINNAIKMRIREKQAEQEFTVVPPLYRMTYWLNKLADFKIICW